MKPGCTLIAYLHAKPEKRDELLKVLHSFVKPSRAEPACVDYHLHVSNDDPNLFVFYENWRTRKELDEHLQTPILTSFWSRRFDLLQKDVDIQFITMLSDPDKISIAGTSRKRESQIILRTDERSIHLDLGRDQKFNRCRVQGTLFRDTLRQREATERADAHRGDQRSGLLRRNAAGDGERVLLTCNAAAPSSPCNGSEFRDHPLGHHDRAAGAKARLLPTLDYAAIADGIFSSIYGRPLEACTAVQRFVSVSTPPAFRHFRIEPLPHFTARICGRCARRGWCNGDYYSQTPDRAVCDDGMRV